MAVSWTDAQAAVIGSALIDARCVPEILADMRAEDFSGEYRSFFEAFRALSAEQTPVDPVTVLAKLGPAYEETARALIDLTPTAANVRAYIAACKEQARLRALQALGTELAGAATLADAREILGRAETASTEASKQDTVTPMELAAMWINAVNAEKKPEYITTGINCLDSVVHTLPGNYHIIAGKTSHGKSALALQIAWHMAQTRKVGYFSNELTDEEFDDRLISMLAPAAHDRVRAKDLDGEELQATGRAAGEIFKSQIHYEPAVFMTPDDIRARTIQRGYEVIIVDYLQLVVYPDKRADRYEAVSEISKAFQQMARNLGIVIFATSQLSRQDDKNDFEPVPPLSALRESGQLEQDADAVIIIHAPLRKAYPRFRVLDVAKNRSGPIDRFFVDYRVDVQHLDAPSLEDYRIWLEVTKKRRVLTADERRQIEEDAKAKRDEDQKRAMERAQRERLAAKYSGGQQMKIGEELP